MTQFKIITVDDPIFKRFIDLLLGPAGINFDELNGTSRCKNDFTYTLEILSIFFSDVDVWAAFDYFRGLGGFCDCEIVFTVAGYKENYKGYKKKHL
jgi:hypothetical protein